MCLYHSIFFLGAAFTRFQTLRLQKVFPEVLSGQVISYGSCQFPTLGFVVERYKQVEAFIKEPFWKIVGKYIYKRTCIFWNYFCISKYQLSQNKQFLIDERLFHQIMQQHIFLIVVSNTMDGSTVDFNWKRWIIIIKSAVKAALDVHMSHDSIPHTNSYIFIDKYICDL